MAKEKEPDASIGHNNTFAGTPGLQDSISMSQGDQSTFGGRATYDSITDNGMEIVDLAARYKIEKTLGKGGMGEVLLATDTRLNRKVAIKRILSDAARNRTAVNRFLTEAKSIAALNHPNVVQIHDYGRSGEGPFLIIEYVDGGTLLDRCRGGTIPIEEAISMVCQLCDGLARAHERGIIHRDIKPANILLTSDGIPKLTDFGLAKVDMGETEMTMAGAVLGTLDFMPPEQRRDASQVDARSDLWSLAATLYQMVTGESPRVIDLDSVPNELRSPLSRALKTKKQDRYQNASELKESLKDCLFKTKPLAPEKPVDLGAGECPSCHTLNEPHRKFCRECGDPLRCSCLKCEHEIPVWDKVCPECGGKQPELIAARLREIEEQLLSAELSRKEHQYQVAMDIAQRVVAIEDRRLNRHRNWALEFVASTKLEWDQMLAVVSIKFQESEALYAEGNAKQALKAIETIDDFNLLPNQRQLRSQLQDLITKENEIAAMVREMKVTGSFDQQSILSLYPKVTDYLDLNPRHPKMINLKDDLIRRFSNFPITDLMKLPKSSLVHLPLDLKRQIPMVNSIGMSLKSITSGTFTMGEGSEAHTVTLTKSFYLGLYPVTQEQYKRVMGYNPSHSKSGKNPVVNVSWKDAVEFCKKLSELPEEKDAGRVYRLPTEAEWEYACRAGSTSKYCFGDDQSRLGEYAWFAQNTGTATHPVGHKKPNAWGLYDMHGNISEWCSDWYGEYPRNPATDPVGPKAGSLRVIRGGSWNDRATRCQSAYRYADVSGLRYDYIGFRVALGSA